MNLTSPMGIEWYWWLCLYTTPGLAYAAYHLLKQYRNRSSEFVREMLKTIRKPKRKSFADYFLEMIAYTMAIICVAIGWPAFFIWEKIKANEEAARELEEDEPQFICTPQHLVAKVDPTVAEASSYVNDPLGLVPALPFGHLNQAWGDFLSDMLDPEDELWSFHIPKKDNCGIYGMDSSGDISGYAKVRRGQVLGEFITESD
jgi:hypothetical protein